MLEFGLAPDPIDAALEIKGVNVNSFTKIALAPLIA